MGTGQQLLICDHRSFILMALDRESKFHSESHKKNIWPLKRTCIRITFNIYYLSFSLSSSWLSSGSSRRYAEGRGCHPAACKLQTLASACSWEGHSSFLVRTGLLHGHPQIMDLWNISRKNDAGFRPALNNAGALLSTRPALQNLSQKKFKGKITLAFKFWFLTLDSCILATFFSS